MLARITSLFPLWALLISAIAWAQPHWFTGMAGGIVPLLALVMFLMGLTLTAADFLRVLASPRAIAIGVVLQFALMPLTAWLIASGLNLPEQLAVGLIVVGCCAGGTASNVICYLAKGNVALSISMTVCSTLVGVVLTPLLCGWYISESIEVDRLSMFYSIIKMVLIPVIAGIVINQYWHRGVKRLEGVLPLAAVLTIVLIIGIIVALNQPRLGQVGALVLLAVIAHNLSGLGLGYGLAKMLGLKDIDCRTVAIEVGMQNSGLGVALSVQYFSTLAALPGAVFSVWHNISGSLLAAWWGRRPTDPAR